MGLLTISAIIFVSIILAFLAFTGWAYHLACKDSKLDGVQGDMARKAKGDMDAALDNLLRGWGLR